MNTIDIQDSRKTIIAFGAGLLIGALLMWVFTSAAPGTQKETAMNGESNTAATNNANTKSASSNTSSNDTVSNDREMSDDTDMSEQDAGNFSVADQSAGKSVDLGDIDFPDGIGWVAVRDYENGQAGNVLGAARYDESVGLVPTTVDLLRATEAGKTYRVSFFRDNGDRTFSKAIDTEIEGSAAYFTAE